MFTLFGVLAIVAAVLLVLVVVIQNSKGGGINSEFTGTGAVQSVFGQRRSSEFIERLTWYFAGAVAILAFIANVAGNMEKDAIGGDTELRIEKTLNGETGGAPALPNENDFKADPKQQPATPAPAGGDAEKK